MDDETKIRTGLKEFIKLKNVSEVAQLKRIADAIEEILRLVKKDQEDSASRQRQWDHEKN